MKLLFIGDIVGSPGRKALVAVPPAGAAWAGCSGGQRRKFRRRQRHHAGHSGYAAGVDVITYGDHLWDQKEVEILLDEEPRFVRLLLRCTGQGSTVIERAGQPNGGVINAQGNTFMRGELDNPFRSLEEVGETRAGGAGDPA